MVPFKRAYHVRCPADVLDDGLVPSDAWRGCYAPIAAVPSWKAERPLIVVSKTLTLKRAGPEKDIRPAPEPSSVELSVPAVFGGAAARAGRSRARWSRESPGAGPEVGMAGGGRPERICGHRHLRTNKKPAGGGRALGSHILRQPQLWRGRFGRFRGRFAVTNTTRAGTFLA
jgi:hypothetical protein